MSNLPNNCFPRALNRRQLLVGAGGVLVALGPFGLAGCGGGEVRGGTQTTGSSIVNVSGIVVLPTGVRFGSVTLVTRESELVLTQATFTAQVPGNMPTVASVIDNASGQVIMPCMIDPSQASVRLDATNVAATLIFLSIGGWTLQTDREAVWAEVLADPATTTFAKVVQTRLTANPFAAVDGDTQLVGWVEGGNRRAQSEPTDCRRGGETQFAQVGEPFSRRFAATA